MEQNVKASSPAKRQLIDEINALEVTGLPEIDNLFVLQGSFVNEEFRINGNSVRLLNDKAFYWGTQVPHPTAADRCFGIACDERYILVCEYGINGADAEIVLLKRRN